MLGYEVGLSLGLVDGEGVAVVGALVGLRLGDSVGATLGADVVVKVSTLQEGWSDVGEMVTSMVGEFVASPVAVVAVGAGVGTVGWAGLESSLP